MQCQYTILKIVENSDNQKTPLTVAQIEAIFKVNSVIKIRFKDQKDEKQWKSKNDLKGSLRAIIWSCEQFEFFCKLLIW